LEIFGDHRLVCEDSFKRFSIEILAIVHFGLFVVMVIVMNANAKMKDSKK